MADTTDVTNGATGMQNALNSPVQQGQGFLSSGFMQAQQPVQQVQQPVQQPVQQQPTQQSNTALQVSQGVTAADSADKTKNNSSPFKDFLSNLWNKKAVTQAAPPPQQVQLVQAVPPKPQLNADSALRALGVQLPTITPEIQEQFRNGDFSGLNGLIQNAVVQAVAGSAKAAQQLANKASQDAQAKATTDARNYYAGMSARQALNTALPFASDPALGPVAESVMARATATGVDNATAVKMTEAFFADTYTKLRAHYESQSAQAAPEQTGPHAFMPTNWDSFLS